MLTASRSPPAHTSSPGIQASSYSPRPLRDSRARSTKVASPIVKPHSTHVYHNSAETSQCIQPPSASPAVQSTQIRCSPATHTHTQSSPHASSLSSRYKSTSTQTSPTRPSMVNAATQYSPPIPDQTATPQTKATTSHIEHLHLTETKSNLFSSIEGTTPLSAQASPDAAMPLAFVGSVAPQPQHSHQSTSSPSSKRSYESDDAPAESDDAQVKEMKADRSFSKKHKPEEPAIRIMPIQYDLCDTRDLVILIASMLMELIRYNDSIPLRNGQLTRFHSRAPPGISVLDYLQRLTTHATLSPPILLSMVYYIDKLCAIYPAFTMTSLTVHRFLITSATVASKGLSDSFWTNKTYARVGGVSVKELALLELEFLVRMKWEIVPRPQILVDYYRSLVERSPGYEMQTVNAAARTT